MIPSSCLYLENFNTQDFYESKRNILERFILFFNFQDDSVVEHSKVCILHTISLKIQMV